eukprot:TRINITY_DN5362_c0_g1_i1.p1 TRINITY_DN5362_c0_g1~~TRINITY_DN5362_c0_g1_i1.p1  ORF type:complete len:227 (+),score=70.18 TRINITY_DN5362_c0_g1_i1:42-683(+)
MAEEHGREGEHMTGTSIIAVAFDGGVVLGADSRTTTGSLIANRVTNKIQPVADNIFCCRSGSSADTETIADYVTYILKIHCSETGDAPTVHTASTLFRQLCYQNKQLLANIICAGWDEIDGGSVYTVPLGGTLVKAPYAIGGSGSTYIFGYCDAHYKPGMTREETLDFVTKALTFMMARDGSSGGLIRTVVVDKDGVHRSMIPGDKLFRVWVG